jgi:hypothetical protein
MVSCSRASNIKSIYNVTVAPRLQTRLVLRERRANNLVAGNHRIKYKPSEGIEFVHQVVKMRIGICERCCR